MKDVKVGRLWRNFVCLSVRPATVSFFFLSLQGDDKRDEIQKSWYPRGIGGFFAYLEAKKKKKKEKKMTKKYPRKEISY